MKKIFPLLALLAMTLMSCNHKELCYLEVQKRKLMVEYDWSEAPEATPAGMCVFFYSLDNPGTYYRFDFDNREGGEIEIPAGKYTLITYNNDTEIVRFADTNTYSAHSAYTRTGDLLEPLYGNGVKSSAATDNGERVFITPDELWGCHATDIVIDEQGVTYTVLPYEGMSRADCEDCSQITYSTQVITLYPHDMLCHYDYEVRNVENAQNVSKISAALSGMASELNLSVESVDKEPVTLPVSGQANADTHKITGKFLTFGHSDDNSVLHKMTFFAVMKDGSKYRIDNIDKLNVTAQVDNAPDRRHVHIIIDGLKLPDSSDENSEWIPTVDDWGVHWEDIHL